MFQMKTLKVIAVIVIPAIIIGIIWGLVFSISGVMDNKDFIGRTKNDVEKLVHENKKSILSLSDLTSSNSKLISGYTGLIYANSNLIGANSDLIGKNQGAILENANQIFENSAAISEIERVVWAHGAKVNRVVRIIFRTAYTDNTASQKTLMYTRDPYKNKYLWDQAILKLNKVELQKIVKIVKIEEQTLLTKNKISKIKERCFKK